MHIAEYRLVVIAHVSVMSCTLAVRTGACLSPQGEFAQESELISVCNE